MCNAMLNLVCVVPKSCRVSCLANPKLPRLLKSAIGI